jgi:hypothetical protein
MRGCSYVVSFAAGSTRSFQGARLFASRPSFGNQPRPPPLSHPDEQKEFEQLLKNHADELERSPMPVNPAAAYSGTHVGINRATGEVNGPNGPEPTRYDDWNYGGRTTDF